MAAIGDPTLRYHLGGDLVAQGWNPTDALMVAIQLSAWVQINRGLPEPLDSTPLVDAIRAQGWLDQV